MRGDGFIEQPLPCGMLRRIGRSLENTNELPTLLRRKGDGLAIIVGCIQRPTKLPRSTSCVAVSLFEDAPVARRIDVFDVDVDLAKRKDDHPLLLPI